MADRTRRAALVGGLVAVVAGVVVGGVVLTQDASGGSAEEPGRPASRFTVERVDLVATQTFDADLRYDDPETVYAASAGTLTWLAADGAALDCGSTAYRLDDRPVTYLCGSVPAWRDLGWGTSGPDVEQLEAYLRDAGYADADMTVDGEFTWATAEAVSAWQEALGVDRDGVVHAGDVVFGPAGRRVAEAESAVGAPVTPGQPVLGTTATSMGALVAVPAHSRSLVSEGSTATVELPDGTRVDATVSSVRTRSGAEPDAEEAPTVEAVLSLPADSPAASWEGARVTAEVESERADGVLAVPVAALTATASGGYAVEVWEGEATPTGAGTRLVEVTLGMFADGMVAISGDGVDAGTVVVIPS